VPSGSAAREGSRVEYTERQKGASAEVLEHPAVQCAHNAQECSCDEEHLAS
jgi:hypothetical protein